MLLIRCLQSLSVRFRRWHSLCCFPSFVAVTLAAYRVLLILPSMFFLFHLNRHPHTLGSWVPGWCTNFPIGASFPLFVFVLTPRLKRCWKCPDTAQTLEATPHPLLESGFFAFCAFAVDSETFSWAAIVPLMHTWLSCLICLKYPAAPLITSLFFPVFWQLFYLFSYFFVPRSSTNRNIKES